MNYSLSRDRARAVFLIGKRGDRSALDSWVAAHGGISGVRHAYIRAIRRNHKAVLPDDYCDRNFSIFLAWFNGTPFTKIAESQDLSLEMTRQCCFYVIHKIIRFEANPPAPIRRDGENVAKFLANNFPPVKICSDRGFSSIKIPDVGSWLSRKICQYAESGFDLELLQSFFHLSEEAVKKVIFEEQYRSARQERNAQIAIAKRRAENWDVGDPSRFDFPRPFRVPGPFNRGFFSAKYPPSVILPNTKK